MKAILLANKIVKSGWLRKTKTVHWKAPPHGDLIFFWNNLQELKSSHHFYRHLYDHKWHLQNLTNSQCHAMSDRNLFHLFNFPHPTFDGIALNLPVPFMVLQILKCPKSESPCHTISDTNLFHSINFPHPTIDQAAIDLPFPYMVLPTWNALNIKRNSTESMPRISLFCFQAQLLLMFTLKQIRKRKQLAVLEI